MEYDLVIIGAGPAGLSAAMYAARYKLKTLILSKDMGGLAATAHIVCNYPSYPEISGLDLMVRFKDQVEKLGVEIKYDGVEDIKKKKSLFDIKTNNNNYLAKKIIFAGGTTRVKLGVEGEEKLVGKGVSYCATCDAGLFKDKTVSVVGGSDAALTAALLLREYTKDVHIIYRGDYFHRGDPSWIELVNNDKKIKKHFNEEISEMIGDKKLEKIKLKSGKTMKMDGVFIEIGSIPENYILSKLKVKFNEKGYIITDKYQSTNIKGLFAAGDVTNNVLKQIVTASSEGAIAAYAAYCSIKKNKRRE